MKKKDTANIEIETTSGIEPDSTESVAEKTDSEVSGVYVYIGPTVKGIITNGSIMRDTKKSILEYIAQRAEAVGLKAKVPKIGRLLVKDKDVSAAKEQLRIGGNGLTRAYEAVLAADEEENK